MLVGTKLSEIPKYKELVISFLKFTDHIDSLVGGTLYMNNLQRYIDMEKESGVRGMGDKLEASQVYANVEIKMYDNATGELALAGTSKSMNWMLNGHEKTPVFCLFALTTENLKIVGENETHYITELDFPPEEVDRMISEFSEKVVMISPYKFLDRVQEAFNEAGYGYKMDKVKYDDYSINSSVRIESYKKNNNEIFFWKDKFFENQNEYRIAITSLEVDEAIPVNIGDISDITNVLEARDLFSNKFQIHISK